MKRVFGVFIFALLAFVTEVSAKEIRILAIGNSFSVDVVEQHLYNLGEAAGTTIVIGNLYIGGCHLEKHWKNICTERKAYSYRKITANGKRAVYPKTSIQHALRDEQWDFVMVQQQSALGGLYCSYGMYLPEMLQAIRKEVAATTKIIIMQTWAYQSNATHNMFAIFDYDQQKMYKALVKAYNKVFKDKQYGFSALVPNGTAIQNGRTYFGDTLTRDGFHLDKRVGRYIGACTICEVLLGKSVVGNTYRPKWLTEREALIAQKAAHAAVLKPTKVTKIK